MKRKFEAIAELTAIEFFSGIGGWSSALRNIGFPCRVVQAYDINTAANEVYEANYHLKPSGKSILNLTSTSLDKISTKVWMMSPPCQPFTRNNQTESRDVKDNRSEPFLHLIDILSKMQNPPLYIALENVVGFESSDCCQRFLDVLDQREYSYEQYHLDPLKLGIPNSRPRYYCIAKLKSEALNEGKGVEIQSNIREIRTEESLTCSESIIPQRNLRFYLDDKTTETEMEQFKLSEEVLSSQSAWCLDIQTAASCYSACFTKSYSRYFKGTGSVILCCDLSENKETTDELFSQELKPLPDAKVRGFDPNWWLTLQAQYPSQKVYLRFFKPLELIRLFGFHSEFVFPAHITLKKQYELIGNSVNVSVVGMLLRQLFIDVY